MENNRLNMYPGSLSKIKNFLKKMRIPAKWSFIIMGLASTIWFLIRVVPKPSRATYPCMRVAAPLASSFAIWIISFFTSLFAFKKARKLFKAYRYVASIGLFIVALIASAIFFASNHKDALAETTGTAVTLPTFISNAPMGTGNGIFPGRVVWAWDQNAVNDTARNIPGSRPWYDANNNQVVIDQMLKNSILKISGKATVAAAWDTLFTNFNFKKHSVASHYSVNQTIFIKINQGTANWNSLGAEYQAVDKKNDPLINSWDAWRFANAGATETFPQLTLALLRQLINECGIPQNNIYIDDPMSHIFKHNYDAWSAEFPNVHYCDKTGTPDGRTLISHSSAPNITFSDNGKVMTGIVDDDQTFFEEMENADYVINIANLKPHVRAGMTLCTKNNFGAEVHESAGDFHPSLLNTRSSAASTDAANNGGYGKYRVLVDLMGCKTLGGNTMLNIVDGLWGGGDNETMGPRRYKMTPFNNHWSCSIFLSQDVVALESVCFDFLRTEFDGVNQPQSNPNWLGVDDYLHQAADPANWPAGIIYKPSGVTLGSLGVHEHWNDNINKQYTRNLGTGAGIELASIPASLVQSVTGVQSLEKESFNLRNIPNPFTNRTIISFTLPNAGKTSLTIFNMQGQQIGQITNQICQKGENNFTLNASDYDITASGVYFACLAYSAADKTYAKTISIIKQ